jgi:hypothetical protein
MKINSRSIITLTFLFFCFPAIIEVQGWQKELENCAVTLRGVGIEQAGYVRFLRAVTLFLNVYAYPVSHNQYHTISYQFTEKFPDINSK